MQKLLVISAMMLKVLNNQPTEEIHFEDINEQERVKVEVSNEIILAEGEASWYSWDGCVGCNPNRIMANGEQLNDSKYTLAITPQLMHKYKLLNDYIIVKNVSTGKRVEAKITDTGGFAKYNRVADLSVATKNAINCTNCEVRLIKINR